MPINPITGLMEDDELSTEGFADEGPAMTVDEEVAAANRIEQDLNAVADKYDPPQPEQTTAPVVEQPATELQKRMSLLDEYKRLTENRNKNNMYANLASAADSIGQSVAKYYGAKPSDNSAYFQNIQKQNEAPIQDLLNQDKVVDVETELAKADPDSDVSKLYRERAIAIAKEGKMNESFVKSLEGLTAKQLEGMGFKGLLSGLSDKTNKFVGMPGILTRDGLPLVRNEQTGKLYIAGTDQEYDVVKQGISGQYKKQVRDSFGREWTQDPVSLRLIPTFAFDESNPPKYIPPADSSSAVTPAQNEASKTPPKKTGALEKREDEDDSAYLSKIFTIKPNLQDNFKEIQSKITSDKQIADLNDAVSNIDTSKALVESNSPGSAPMLARALLSIYESGGRFTDQDVEQMKGPSDFKARMKRALVTNFDSTQAVSDVDQAAQMELLKILEKKKTEQLSKKYVPYINQLNKVGVDKDVAARYVTGDRVSNFSDLGTPKSLGDPNKKEPNGDDVITIISNGKEYSILKKNLEAAKKRDPKLTVKGQ